ncbi:DUF3987 domain-containing protein [Flavobacterium lacustre]|uniref:DUF3987 domain-containing protein n=1 Tax=Flavobacterium lacustre TaxID=3016339 RepID=UPI0022B63DB3|nr:DUF3987 domain-containing protein [Flavobacterium lacustre]
MEILNNGLTVSVYKDFKNNLGSRNLLEILQEIKEEKYKSDINSIRYAIHKGDDKTADKIKSGLIGFTTSATFGATRTKVNVNTYSQVIGLDFDHIPLEDLQNISVLINQCNLTMASFISPSGAGIKVFIKVNSNAEQHTEAYHQVATYYKDLSGFDFDPKCKDITRLCFLSSDADLYLNQSATIFELKDEVIETPKTPKKEIVRQQSTDELLDKCLKFTEQKEQYFNGNRNNFIHLLASNSNRFGIYEEDTLDFCMTNFDLDTREIKNAVNSAYKNQIADFAKFAKFANLQTSEQVVINNNSSNTIPEEEDVLKSTPFIPQSVYDNLPPILLESCKAFNDKRERDVFLTGALAILSGCLPNVSGVYHGSTVYPCLYSFILAPAASGKGVLKFSKALADKYHEKILAESLETRKIYEENLAAFKMLKGKGKTDEKQEMPAEPKFKVVFIPGNVSDARVIQHLDWNEGKGIICETEADTVGTTMKKEWGSYSDMLRKAFHHENISVSRKTNSEYVEVNEPQLAIALSGTPKQIFNIIPSAEDGLFSRFFFYVFKTDAVWLDPSPKGNPVNLTDYFTTQSKKVLKMVEYFERDSMQLQLSEEQWDKFNDLFGYFLEQVNTFVSDDALSVVKRLALILYRFCMIFTAIRKFSNNEYAKEVYSLDVDFESAVSLVKTYLQHSIIMFNNLPKQGEQGPFKGGDNKKQFFDALPKRFTRKEAIELSNSYNLKERTVDNLLKTCIGVYLAQPEYGVYEKS